MRSNTGQERHSRWEIFFDEQILPIKFEDLENFIHKEAETRYEYIKEFYKNVLMDTTSRWQMLAEEDEEWRSNVRVPITYQYHKTTMSMIKDSDVDFVIKQRDKRKEWEDDQYKKDFDTAVINDILDWFEYVYDFSKVKKELHAAYWDAALLGFGVCKLDFIKHKKYVDVTHQGLSEKVVEDSDFIPWLRWISPFNIFVSPWTKDLDSSCRFVIERKLMPASKVKEAYAKFWLELREKDIEKSWHYVLTKDYETIKENMQFYNTTEPRDVFEDDIYDIRDSQLEIYEVVTQKYTSIFINWIYHGTYTNMLIFDDFPYYVFNYENLPWTIWGVWLWYLLEPLQKVSDKILNTRLDNVQLTQNKMIFVDPSVDMMWGEENLKTEPGKVFKVPNPRDNVQPFELWEINQSNYTEIQQLFTMVEQMTWISGYLSWAQGKVERAAASAQMLKESWFRQIRSFLDSIRREMARFEKHMLVSSLAYVSHDTLDKVLWPDNKLKEVSIDDIVNNYDFDFEVKSMRTENKIVEREQLMQLLQMAGWFMTVDWRPLIDVQAILDKLLKTFNLEDSLQLSPEEFEERMKETAMAQTNVEQAMQKKQMEQQGWQMEQQGWWWWVDQQLAEMMWNIQRHWWAEWDASTNREGVQE